MTHPLKTVEAALTDLYENAQDSFGLVAEHDNLITNIYTDALETIRAIMGQNVDVEMLIHEIIGATQIPPGTTSRHYLRQAIDHLASTGRICGVPDGWVMVRKELFNKAVKFVEGNPPLHSSYDFDQCPAYEDETEKCNCGTDKLIPKHKEFLSELLKAASTPGGGDE
jgi:hypothetical protein